MSFGKRNGVAAPPCASANVIGAFNRVRIIGTVFMHPGSEPDRLLDRSNEMFTPVAEAIAKLGDIEISDPDVEVILVNRFYLRGVEQVDRQTGEPPQRLPGASMGGTSF